MSKYVNVPVLLQIIGVVVFGLTVWQGVHGGLVKFGLIAGALMLYIGRHYTTVYNEFQRSLSSYQSSKQ